MNRPVSDNEQEKDLSGYVSSEGQHETSFITASEGDSTTDPEEPVRSSRTMPVPEFLKPRTQDGSRKNVGKVSGEDLGDGMSEQPPPSYEEAVADTEPTLPVPIAAAEDDGLTPEEINVIMRSRESLNAAGKADGSVGDGPDFATADSAFQKRQKERSSYLPSDRRGSYEEAIEMHYGNSSKLPAEVRRSAVEDLQDEEENPDEPPRRLNILNIEDGPRAETREKPWKCESCGPLNEPISRFCSYLRRQSAQKLALICLLFIAIIGLVLFVSLFPASFVYVNYHEIALKQSKLTNVVDRDTVYYTGCYVLGPDSRLITFTSSVHTITEEISMFTIDTISLTVRFSAHYFIRPPEVGQLYSLFMKDYDSVFRLIVRSTLRALAGSTFSVDNFRFNRTYVETQMHSVLRKRLGGDCCPSCCKQRECQSNTYCSQCKTAPCDQGYHVDVRYFNLLSVSIPNEVFERMLYRTVLEVRKEREFYIQDHAAAEKETEQITQEIKNRASEIVQASQAEANKIAAIAEAERDKLVQNSYVTALNGLFSRLNVTQEDHKLSLLMIKALEDMDNLYAGYGFDENTLFTP